MSEENNVNMSADVAAVLDGAPVVTPEEPPVAWVDMPTANSLREYILNVPDLASEIVEVVEWKCRVKICGLTGAQRAKLLTQKADGGVLNPDGSTDSVLMYPSIMAMTCYHPVTNELLFSFGDVNELNRKSGGVLERLAQVGLRLSGLDKKQEDSQKN